MTYKEAMTYIRNTAAFGTKLGLDNIRALMSLLGDPQEKLKIIHIAGTNGKGSVAAYLLSVLRHAGYRVGSYTSPELFRFSERIKTGDEEISEDDIAQYATKVRAAADHMKENNMGDPSEFELVLAMAFCFFLDRNVDIVILETGLGGRLDATNVISHSVLSVITKISFDHMQYLGDTLPKIAAEKAAIIKPQGTALVYPASEDVMNVFRRECETKNATLKIAALPERISASLSGGQTFLLSDKTYKTRMAGLYESDNAALAIQALEMLEGYGISVSEDDICDGIKDAIWPGRFEILSSDPCIIADGAHNEDGAAALSETLSAYFDRVPLVLCIGILKDKQYHEMLSRLLPHASSVIACTVPNPRSLSASALSGVIHEIRPDLPVTETSDIDQALAEIKKLQRSAAAVVICGSLYLVGPLRERWIKNS